MRGKDQQSDSLFSYIRLETRIPADHPLRPIRKLVDEALLELSPAFSKLYAREGRPSIPPERLRSGWADSPAVACNGTLWLARHRIRVSATRHGSVARPIRILAHPDYKRADLAIDPWASAAPVAT